MPKYKLFTIGFDQNSQYANYSKHLAIDFDIIDTPFEEAEPLRPIEPDEKKPSLILVDAAKRADETLIDAIKALNPNKKLPVVILTETHDANNIDVAYQAGAHDIFDSNFPVEELSLKLHSIAKSQQQQLKVEKKYKNAQLAAFDAMADSAELGHALHFVSHSFDCNTFEELAKKIFETYSNLSIKGSLLIYDKDTEYYFSDDDEDRPLEVKLINSYRAKYLSSEVSERFVTFNNRILVFTAHTALFVRHVEENKQGRVRDILGAITTGLEARAHNLMEKQKEALRIEIIRSLLAAVKDASFDFRTLFENHERETIDIIDHFIGNMNNGFSILDLTENQEAYFVDLANETIHSLIERYTDEVKLKDNLEKIVLCSRALTKVI